MTRTTHRYVGPLPAVIVGPLPSGRVLEVARGDEVSLLASEAEALTDHPDWEAVEPPADAPDDPDPSQESDPQ